MNFNNLEELKKAGFTGFKKMSELFEDSSEIPFSKGVYMVLYQGEKIPEFIINGTGGNFKGKNPNISISELKSNWVENTIVVYIGKAGKNGSNATLNSRIKQYCRFGQGFNVGHWGGRYIWQIKNSNDLLVCWKTLNVEDPRIIETSLIRQFDDIFNKLPFANLAK